jgi:hypothetical protein
MTSKLHPTIPKAYWIREDLVRCKQCTAEFKVQFAHGNEVVKFIEDGGYEDRWLPTFEKGGYLDLLERLVAGYRREQQITMPIAKRFESAFKGIQEVSSAGKPFSVAIGARCPHCSSASVDVLDEQILASPPLKWLCYQSSGALGKV